MTIPDRQPPLPTLHPAMDFDDASAAVVDYLKQVLPMGFWAVTRYDGERQLYLEVRDDSYGAEAGGSHRWEDSFCVNMTAGRTPQIAPDAMAIPEYAASGVSRQLDIGSYVGIPIHRSNGELFGTLCGLDPEKRSEELKEHAPLLSLLSSLLSAILEADHARTELQRAIERAETVAETDVLTGLLNRRGWDRHLEAEEARYARFGDLASVVIVDLDALKLVNDELGHEAGDRLIALAAETIRDAVRPHDIVARLGGDEFGAILTRAGTGECEAVVARLRDALSSAGVEASLGSAPYTVADGFAGAVRRADAEMYAEKRRSRPTVSVLQGLADP